jgi:hypothetical protein
MANGTKSKPMLAGKKKAMAHNKKIAAKKAAARKAHMSKTGGPQAGKRY